MWRRRRRRRCDGDDDGVGGGGDCGGGEGDGDSDGGCGGGGCVGVRAGGGALELMVGRGYAIWGMQFFFVQLCISRRTKFTCAYTVPKFAYLVRDKKGTQNRVGYSKKVASRHDLSDVTFFSVRWGPNKIWYCGPGCQIVRRVIVCTKIE